MDNNTNAPEPVVLRDERGRWLKGGPSPNPRGRTPAGKSITEGINFMIRWRQEEVQAVADDENAPLADRLAAAALVNATKGGAFGMSNWDRVMDRTVGKPAVSVSVQTEHSVDPAAELAQDTLLSIRNAALAQLNEGLHTPRLDGDGT